MAGQLNAGLGGLEGLATPHVAEFSTHVYYVYGLTLDTEALGVSRAKLIEALRAEGVPGLMPGYVNVHRLPIFTQQVAYGTGGHPWTLRPDRNFAYGEGTCPVAERLHDRDFLGINLCMFQFPEDETQMVIDAFVKMWGNLDALKG